MAQKYSLNLIIILCLSVVLFTTSAFAHSLHPDLEEKLRKEGKLDDYAREIQKMYAKGIGASKDPIFSKTISMDGSPDTLYIPVLLVEFSDNLASGGLVYADSSYFDSIFNSENTMQYGSMREYYQENSYGQLTIIADVYGWYMMPYTYDFYVDGQKGFGDYPQNAQGLVEDAIFMSDAEIDYSKYDRDGDSRVEALVLVHAGAGYEISGDSNMIHSHNWMVNNYQTDDYVYIRTYNMNPEENSITNPEPINIGVFCHEFGHSLGLPDLYDTDYSSNGVGIWSVMASGSYSRNSASPTHMDAWCKTQLGWVNPVNITANEIGHEFPQVETSGHVARLWSNGEIGSQYFLIENRQRSGFDGFLPGEGLCIWHVDDSQHDNDHEYSYRVALEQADGLFELEENKSNGDAEDLYPGPELQNAREFSEVTVPASFTNPYLTGTYPDTATVRDTTGVAVWNISDSDSVMTANLDIFFSRPKLELLDYYVDEIDGDGDDFVESGETHALYVQFSNSRADGLGMNITASLNNDSVILNEPYVFLGDIPAGDTLDNFIAPVTFTIPEDVDQTIAVLDFKIADGMNSDSIVQSVQFNIGRPAVLLVDHDNNYFKNYETYYTDVFDSMKVTYERYARDDLGTPGDEFLSYPIIVWFTNFGWLEHSDVVFLQNYLDQGGKLFLTGQNIGQNLAASEDSLFLRDYLKCEYDTSKLFYFDVRGVDGSEIGADSLRLQITGWDGATNQNSQDIMKNVDPSATTSLVYYYNKQIVGICGVEYRGDYNLVYWSFGFEAITSTVIVKNTRYEAMDRVLGFLNNIVTDVPDDIDASSSIPTQFTLYQNYPNPFNPTTRISYDLTRSFNNVNLKIYNILGQEVVELVDEAQDAGSYEVVWDATDAGGRKVSSGIYFYRLVTENQTLARKMVLLK